MNLRKTPRTLVLTAGYVGLIHVAAGLSLLLRFDGRVPHAALVVWASVAPAFTVLIGASTYDACKQYVAVEQVPGLQLKGKSADKFRVYQAVSIREDPASPWVPFPTEGATNAYTAIRRSYGAQLVFASSTPGDLEE